MTTLIDIQKDLDQIQKKRFRAAVQSMADRSDKVKDVVRRRGQDVERTKRKLVRANTTGKRNKVTTGKKEGETEKVDDTTKKKEVVTNKKDKRRDYLAEDKKNRGSGVDDSEPINVGSGNNTSAQIKAEAKRRGMKKKIESKAAVVSSGKNEKTGSKEFNPENPSEEKPVEKPVAHVASSTTSGTGNTQQYMPKEFKDPKNQGKGNGKGKGKITAKPNRKIDNKKIGAAHLSSQPIKQDSNNPLVVSDEVNPKMIGDSINPVTGVKTTGVTGNRVSTQPKAGTKLLSRDSNTQVKEITQSFTRITAQVQGLRDISKQKTLVNNIGIMANIFKSHYKIKGHPPLQSNVVGDKKVTSPNTLAGTGGATRPSINWSRGSTTADAITNNANTDNQISQRDSQMNFATDTNNKKVTGFKNEAGTEAFKKELQNLIVRKPKERKGEKNVHVKTPAPDPKAQHASWSDTDIEAAASSEGNDPAGKFRGNNKKTKKTKRGVGKSLRLINQTNRVHNIINKMGMIAHRDGSTTSYDKKFDASVNAGLALHAAKLEKNPYAGKFDPTKSPQYDGKTGKFIGKRPQEKDLKRWTPQPINQSTSQALHKLIADVRKVKIDLQGQVIKPVTQGVKGLTQGKYADPKALGNKKGDQKVLTDTHVHKP